MRRALELARRGWGRVSPNPMVGALVVRDDDVLGEGWHEGPGSVHAEVMALREAGNAARGATVVVTLEPCHRFGRTPPCTDALVEAGVARVVVAATDPNLGEGAPGLTRLREAGIAIETGPLEDGSRRLNRAFESHVRTGRPFVLLKAAASLDGKTAAADGSSKWITGAAARADVQRLRAWADAIVVGSGTVLADDPALTVRDPAWTHVTPPLRVVVDARGRVPADRAVFDGSAPTVVATTPAAPRASVAAWDAAGAEVLEFDPDPDGGVELPALLDALGKRDVQGLLLEGGATLAGGFARQDLLDALTLYVAPLLVGGADAPGVLGGAGLVPIGAARRLRFTSIEPIGDDVRMEADVHRDR
jgi:diaminohydroxyphosphoribosylaminopyrimidine deaminase/5-amino-6-(5-phosphoribosylamino)uracil reductase